MERLPLEGLRIIAVEQFGAGPFTTLQLADMGAEVIKVEDPAVRGDVGRHIPPLEQDDQSLYFEAFNRGKRSITLNLKHPAGRTVFERLVARADVVFNNLRGDQVERLGLTYDQLKHVNPRIICASLSAYGRTGERAAEPGYDPLVQAEAGWAMLTGEPGGPPVRSGLPLADYATGLACALAILVALWDGQRTGQGRNVDANLFDVALSLLSYQATWQLSAGIRTERQPLSAHPSIVPFQFFGTRDGYIAVACAKQKFFEQLVLALDLPELLTDPRFATMQGRQTNREAVLGILERRFRDRSTDEWMALLYEKVPVAPVQTMEEVLDPDALDRRGMLVHYPHPLFGEVRSVGPPFSMDDVHPSYRRAPELGSDTVDILQELGFDREEIQALHDVGAI